MSALTAEQLAAVSAFVKEAQDFARANIIDAFLIKHGTIPIENCVVGDNVVVFLADGIDVTRDDPYDDTSYVITIIKAIDAEGIDVKGELVIPENQKTVNGFTINVLTPCTIEWQTCRKTPRVQFYT